MAGEELGAGVGVRQAIGSAIDRGDHPLEISFMIVWFTFSVPYCILLYRIVLYHTALYPTAPYSAVLYRTIPYCSTPYCTIHTVPYRTVP